MVLLSYKSAGYQLTGVQVGKQKQALGKRKKSPLPLGNELCRDEMQPNRF
jgi:hypothetical protein